MALDGGFVVALSGLAIVMAASLLAFALFVRLLGAACRGLARVLSGRSPDTIGWPGAGSGTKICGRRHCGHANVAVARFCGHCGQRL